MWYKHSRGQALVEFALITPLLLFTILGGVEAGFLLITKADQDRSTAVVADWAAEHHGEAWNSVANHELPGCAVNVSVIGRDLMEVTSRCPYRARILVGMFQIPISSRQTAAMPRSHDSTPTPAASPSS